MSEFYKHVQREYNAKLKELTTTFGMREEYVKRALANVDPTLPQATELLFHWMEENPDTGGAGGDKSGNERKKDVTPGKYDPTQSRLNTAGMGPLEISNLVDQLVAMGFKKKYVETGLVLNNNDFNATIEWVIERQERDERYRNSQLKRDLEYEDKVATGASRPRLSKTKSADIPTISIPPPGELATVPEEKKEDNPGGNVQQPAAASAPQKRPGRQRNRVIKELMRSELRYIQKLHTLLSAYLFPCLDSLSTSQPLLEKEDIGTLFGCTQTIFNMHKKFLKGLRSRAFETPVPPPLLPDVPALNAKQVAIISPEVEAQISAIAGPAAMQKKQDELRRRQDEVERLRTLVKEPVDDLEDKELAPFVVIGDYLHAYAPFFKTYQVYVEGHSRAISLLDSIERGGARKYAAFRAFLRATQEVHNAGLRNMLDAPLERATRFATIIDQLIDFTHPQNVDRKYLHAARMKVLETGDAIMHTLERNQVLAKMHEISKKFSAPVPCLAGPTPQVFRYCFSITVKQPARMKNKISLFVFDDVLLLATGSSPYKLRNTIEVANVSVTRFEESHTSKPSVMTWKVQQYDRKQRRWVDPIELVMHIPVLAEARQLDQHIKTRGHGSQLRRQEAAQLRQLQKNKNQMAMAKGLVDKSKQQVDIITAGAPVPVLPTDLTDLRVVLNSQEGLMAFTRFLTDECSVENAMFWEDVRAFRAYVSNARDERSAEQEAELRLAIDKAMVEDPSGQVNIAAIEMQVFKQLISKEERDMARRIVTTYIGERAPCQVNLSAPIVKRTLRGYLDVYCEDDTEEKDNAMKSMPPMGPDDWASPELDEDDVVVAPRDPDVHDYIKAKIDEKMQEDEVRAILTSVLDGDEDDDDLSGSSVADRSSTDTEAPPPIPPLPEDEQDDGDDDEDEKKGKDQVDHKPAQDKADNVPDEKAPQLVVDAHSDVHTVFDEAWHSVFALMEVDAFRRFLFSEHFEELRDDMWAVGLGMQGPAPQPVHAAPQGQMVKSDIRRAAAHPGMRVVGQ